MTGFLARVMRLLVACVCGNNRRMPKLDLRFINTDVERQREVAQEALDIARTLDFLIEKESDESTKNSLVLARDNILKVARKLALNANTTTSTASTIVDEIVTSARSS